MKTMRLFSLASILASSRRTSWREQNVAITQMLIDFLQANNLATRELIPSGQQVPLDFELWASDLTEEGNEFYKTAVQKWYRALDRGTDPKNSKILERELKKMREGDAAKG